MAHRHRRPFNSYEDSFRSKEDDLAKISSTVFVTNFPETCTAKELFHACKPYGHVVDSFIPSKRGKNGKRFGFVRFINVFSEERLVNNLCTVWIDRWKLQVNVSRFHRNSSNGTKEGVKGTAGKGNDFPYLGSQKYAMPKTKDNGKERNSYVDVLKKEIENEDKLMSPAIVMDDGCLTTRDFSKTVLGRLKEFASLANLKMVLNNEGFDNIKIQYMGEFWVLLEFGASEAVTKFRENVSISSWFSCIKEASMEFKADKRIAWVEVEGVPLKLWSNNTFTRIANKWGHLLDVDDQEDTCFHSKRLCVHTKLKRSISEDFKVIHAGTVYWVRAKETPGWVPDFVEESDEDEDQDGFNINDDAPKNQAPRGFDGECEGEDMQDTKVNEGEEGDNIVEEGEVNEETKKSEDPFNIYSILNKKTAKGGDDNKSEESLKFPPGLPPLFEGTTLPGDNNIRHGEEMSNKSLQEDGNGNSSTRMNMKMKIEGTDSISSGHFKKSEAPRTGGSILGLLDEVVKVGQVMGYKMEGCMSNMAEIIEAQGAEVVFR